MKKRVTKTARPTVADHYPNGMNKALEKVKMSKGELSRRIDVERPYLSRLSAGHYLPSVAMAIAIARTLDTTVEALWGKLKFEDCRRR